MIRYVPILLLLAQPMPAAAQAADAPQALPDPATVKAPDVSPSQDPKVRSEGYKFYYFNNPTVSFADAYQDLVECRGHLVVAGPAQVPGFIPWDEAHRRKTRQGAPLVGGPDMLSAMVGVVVVSAMAAIILPKMERGARSNKMRRCMGTRGYERYAITEDAWNALNKGDEQQLLLMQAKLAAAPKPQDEAVTE
jgi:hypothetical protein